MNAHTTRILTRRDVERLLDIEDAIDAVTAAFVAHGRGEALMPAKVYLDLPRYGGDFRAMPAYLPSLGAASLKWINSHPSNPERGLPAVIGVLVLSDPETALPRAIMDATHITAVRTGAAGGVAARALARPGAEVLALIGAGVQAPWQLRALRTGFTFREIRIVDPSIEALASFRAACADETATIRVCHSARQAVEGAEIIVTTTPSREPLVLSEWVDDGAHINAIGADAPGKRELDTALVLRSRIVVDDMEQAHHSGEINVPLAENALDAATIGPSLGEILAGKATGRADDGEVTLFDSTGLAIQDLALAHRVVARAEVEDVGELVELV